MGAPVWLGSMKADRDLRAAGPGWRGWRRFVHPPDTAVIHRIGTGIVGRTAEDVVRFFTEHPEGVATVTLTGSRDRKRRIVKAWSQAEIPRWAREAAACPYHGIIDSQGVLTQTLPLDVRGAHAAGWNYRALGIGVIGNFRGPDDPGPAGERPTEAQLQRLRRVLRDLMFGILPLGRVLSHDVANQRRERPLPAKGCPGQHLATELPRIAEWARLAALQLTAGHSRR